VEHHAVTVDQEMLLRAGQARADVGVDEVGPAMMRDQASSRAAWLKADVPDQKNACAAPG